jgi:Family of unknown function (DUF5336)
MTNTTVNSAYAGDGVPSSAHGWYPLAHSESGPPADVMTRCLWSVVSILGPAAFAVSFASPEVFGLPVQLGIFAAIVAAVGLLRGQAGRGWIVVALTLTGFLDAAATWVESGETRWALSVIMVLGALQSLAAVGALLLETRSRRSADSQSARDYLAYSQFAAAYQAYATQYQQPSAPYTAPQASAQAHGEASATAPADAEQESLAALQARYARHGVGPAQQSHGSRGATSARPVVDPGMPGADRGVPGSRPYRPQQDSPGQASSL